MIINKKINEYVVSISSSLQDALNKINENKHKVVYAVDEKNHLVGSLSDGDVRRWLLTTPTVDLNTDLINIVQVPCFSMSKDSSVEAIEKSFNEKINSIPLVDDSGHLTAIAEPKADFIFIDDCRVSKEDSVFVIAEIGNNHQGDICMAKKMIDFAVEANVDCVKFQMRSLSSLYKNEGEASDASADLGAQYVLDLLAKFQLTDEELFEAFDYCKQKDVIPICTPWDLDSLNKLEQYGMVAYKVASADFTNYQLLGELAKTGKPLICSTGMSNESEIVSTVAFLKRKNVQFILLHCNSTYPAPFKDVNLRYLNRLSSTSGGLVGYSGHERGWAVAVAAVALGAKVIEKHFTFDRDLEGNDHKVSLLPDEFKQMVLQIRQVEQSLGDDRAREVTQGELMNREILAKSLMANKSISAGEIIDESMVDVKSPGQGLQPNRLSDLIGKKAIRDFVKGDFFFETDINASFVKKEKYNFSRPYGIPVRFHDFQELTEGLELDFVEFHLSYKDLEVNIEDYINKNQTIGLAVHAPELFSEDHILDLASLDGEYRKRSIIELQRVVDKTNELKKYFPNAPNPVVVVNVGGWDSDGFLDYEAKMHKYSLVKSALLEIDATGVVIGIQTMPPFPWHFGGQSHHNLFLDPNEIVNFCNGTDFKICLDVSHSMMACNYYSWDLYDFVEIVAPYIAHMHIVDAKGDDGEGVQLGEGDVDFKRLGELLERVVSDVQFIPEVWQGHKNRGEGFWNALSFLENHM